MKPTLRRNILLALPLAASALLASCVSNDHRSARHSHTSGSGYTTYASLPSNYSGDAYFYNNRYYAGGRYERGTYTHRGRTYDHRYYHNGQYIYGGEYRRQTASASHRNRVVRTSTSTASHRNRAGRTSTSTAYVTYRTLPRNHSGSAYYYNNRYYAGGRYEPGTFTYRGRTYDHRYYHNGQYFYGGEYRQSASAGTAQRSTVRRSAPISRTAFRRVSY